MKRGAARSSRRASGPASWWCRGARSERGAARRRAPLPRACRRSRSRSAPGCARRWTASRSRSRAGEVHALLGENGAGKSTLMNVLAGLVRPDAGALELAGERIDLARWGPRGARAHGVGMVHQHSALVPAFTRGGEPALRRAEAGPWFHPARELRAAEALLAPLRARGAGRQCASRSSRRASASAPRSCARSAAGRGVLILDEPTAVLTPGEARALFAACCGACATPAAPWSSSRTSSRRSSRSPTASRSCVAGAWSRTSPPASATRASSGA